MIRTVVTALRGLPRAAGIAVLVMVVVSLVAPLLAPYDPNAIDLGNAFGGPGAHHLLGTDQLGRDLLSRLLLASQTTITAVAAVIGCAIVVGGTIGVLAGAIGGIVDEIVMRVTDVFMSIPSMVIALAVIGAFGTGYLTMIIALTLGWWSAYARLSRSVVLSTKEQPHIEALKVLGASPVRIFGRHLVPAAIGPALVYAAGDAGLVALSVASLSFLGMGVKPPQSEWGQMLVDGTRYLESDAMLVILPGAALTLFVVTLNVFSRSIALRSSQGALPRATLARRLGRLPSLAPRAARVRVAPDRAKRMVSQ
ncbi:ABC transporter permease [Amycolatopsis sp. GM8]|uniref:ABC transporter permease n=1 Tax=Amycolatopsis sp. GM8 TaxID=2896530 RepID=UPI001F1F18F2|nr:ABC transporter permease [Amycolatopsis sp. GM8]